MDEKLIDELFNRATSLGYKKTRQDFISLLGSDDEVYMDMMSYARSKGMAEDPTEFDALIGRTDKKKVQSLVLSEELKKQKPAQAPAMASSLQGGSLESQGYPKPLIPQQRPVADVTYRKAPIETTEQFGQVAKEEARKEEAIPEFAKPLIETVTPELTKKREEDVVPQLNYQFGSLGFKFKESGIGDYVEAIAPNGKKINISVDEMDVNEATKLRNFIRNNTISIPEARLKEIEKQYSAENKKFTSDKEVEASIAQLSIQANQLNKDIQDYYISTKLLEEQGKKLASLSEEDPNREVLTQQYIAERDRLQKQIESISKRQENINNNKAQLDASVGKYTAMKADQGTWYGEVINAPLRTIGDIISGGYGQMVDILEETAQPLREFTGDKATMDAYIKYAKEEGIATPKADENGNISKTAFRDWLSSIGDKASEYRGKFVDERKKEEKYKIVEGKPLADVLRGLVVEGIGMENTEEYAKEVRKGIIPRAILGGIGSIPSFAFGNAASRAARLFLQTDDAIMKEMQDDPDFKDVSEREKRMISTPIALAGAALEEIGFRNIIANKGLLNKMTMSALGKAGATTTAKTFGDLVKNEVESGLARGTLTIVGGALAEAETGAAQQAAELVIKDVYNLIKDKRNENGEYMKMFDTPDSFGEYAKDVAIAGLEEAIGGFVLGMPSAISAAARAKGFEGMDDTTFELFEAASKDENIEKAYVTRLKNQINSGEITIEQAKDNLNEYRKARGLFQSVPENLDLQGKKKAMNLLRERQELESSIQGKDEALTAPQRNRIKTINEELTKISEDAVQKQATDEGVLRSQRPQLELQQMGEGDKEPQVAPARTQEALAPEVKKEEVKVAPIDFSKQLEEKYGVAVDLLGDLESDKPLSLSRIVVPEEKRNQGVGSQVMRDIIEYANRNNKKLALTPSTDFGGESVGKLTSFYKQFGFVENKGKNKDFTIKDSMYRIPEVSLKTPEVTQEEIIIDDNQPYTFEEVEAPIKGDSLILNGNLIGGIEYSPGIDGDAEINYIEIKPEFKNKGYAKNIIGKILAESNNKKIIGLATKESIPFWNNLGAEFIGEADADGTIDFVLTENNFNNAVSLETPAAPAEVTKARVAPVQFPTVTTTLQTEGTGVGVAGQEPVVKGNNAATVNLSTNKEERYADDYTTDQIIAEEHAPNSRVVSVASNLGTGSVSYTKKGEKVSFNLPFVNKKISDKIEKLRAKYRAVKGTGKEAKTEKAKIAAEINKTAKQQLIEFQNMMTQNLLALYDSLTDAFIAESKQWYVGANRMAQSIAQKYNLSLDQVGGIIAVLSPQNDWFNNVSVAERSIEVMSKYADQKLTKDIVDKAVTYNTDKKTGEPNNFAKDLLDLFNQYGEVSINELQDKGLSIDTQAAMLRAFDQALHSPKVAMTDPNGKFVGFDTTPVRWNSNTEIGKAITIYRNGSIESINSELGNGNKVRNFYNNIVDPDSETPYLTADTHALSAALNSPISANDAGGIGLFNGGAEPLYALVKNAYIDAARIVGIKPREMQSITWEAQRIGINDKNRTPEQKQKTFDYITETRTNNQTPYERATELIARNRSANPSWGKSRGIETQKSSDEIRQGAKLRAEQRASEVSALRGPSGERVGAAPAGVGGAVAGRGAVAEGVKARVQYGLPVTNTQGVSDLEASIADDKKKKSVIDAIKKVTNLFKSLFPNAEIYIYETEEDFNAYASSIGAGRGDLGLFTYKKNPDGSYVARIDINLSKADATTVYHEVAHAVMLKAFGDNQVLFVKFKNQISKALKQSTVGYLNAFASQYNDKVAPEEWLVEMSALLSETGATIKIDTITKIASIVNKFVSDLTNGLVKPFSETASKKEVIDFFNQMASSIRTGQEIDLSKQKIAKPADLSNITRKEAARVEMGPEDLPGYDKLIDDVTNTVIPNALKRRLTGQQLIDLVNRFVTRSEVYKKADDIQKDAIVRAVNGMIGESYKEPPSVAKILGKVKDIAKITVSEKDQIKFQFKVFAKGAKTWAKITKEVAETISDLANTGKITPKQLSAVLSRFAKVSMFDDGSIDRFVDYMAKVFAKAEYLDQIAAVNKALPTAKKNIETKLGVSKNLIPVLRKLLAIKPNLIPDALFEDYANLVSMMGERRAVLNLQESGEVMDTASKILNAVEEEQSLAYELADMYNDYADKVLDDNGNVDYAETIKKMLADGKITASDLDVMKKYKSIISPREGATPMTEQELADEKNELINFVQDADIDVDTLPSRDERDTARKLNKLKNTNALSGLTNNELKNLLRVINNINNGFLPHYAQLMIEKLESMPSARTTANSIKKAKLLPFSKIYARLKSLALRGKKDAITLMFERNPIYYYDQILGDFDTKSVYDSIFKPIANAYATFKSFVTSRQERINKAFNKVEKSFKNEGNAVLMSKYKMTTYLLQLEYLSNPESNKVNSAIEFLNATIKKIRKNQTTYSERDAVMLQEIADKYAPDGEIDIDKLYNSFNDAEKSAIRTIQEINAEMTPMAEYIAGVLRGEKFTPINNYVHHDVMVESSITDSMADADAISNFNSRMNPSTRAKSLMERTPGAKAIEFDITKSVNQALNSQAMDYYLTAPIRTARKTLNETEKILDDDASITSEQNKIFNAIKSGVERAIETTLINSYSEGTVAEELVNELSKQGYRAVLASIPRFGSELISNVSGVLTAYANEFAAGVKLSGIYSTPEGVDVMRNVRSNATTRLYKEDALGGKMVDPAILDQTSGIKGGRARSAVGNKLQQIYNNTLKKQKNSVEFVADGLISTPDKLVMRPTWFGAFEIAFENVAGVKPDFQKIAANDEQYMSENAEAIESARDRADDVSIKIGATDNPFVGVLKGTVTRNQSAWAKAFNNFNNFMSRFLINEYVTARTAIYAAMGKGMISKSEGIRLLAAVTLRMVVYSTLTPMLSNMLTQLVWGSDDEEEEDEKSLLQKIGQGMASAFTSLTFGRDFGNATKNIINYGIEKINQEYLDFLREGEYDPYKDAIQYSMIPVDPKAAANTTTMDIISRMGGSMGPALQTSSLILEKGILKKGVPKEEQEPETLKQLIKKYVGIKGKTEEAEARREKEIGVRIPFEVMGNLGYIPLYKDVRKVLLKEIYKDLNDGKKDLKNKKELEKLLLQGYENKTDMRRYDPELYEVTFGEKGVYNLLDVEKYRDKLIDDVIDDVVRDIKDDLYQYTPKQNSDKFGGGAFGGKKKKSEFGGGKFGQ